MRVRIPCGVLSWSRFDVAHDAESFGRVALSEEIVEGRHAAGHSYTACWCNGQHTTLRTLRSGFDSWAGYFGDIGAAVVSDWWGARLRTARRTQHFGSSTSLSPLSGIGKRFRIKHKTPSLAVDKDVDDPVVVSLSFLCRPGDMTSSSELISHSGCPSLAIRPLVIR